MRTLAILLLSCSSAYAWYDVPTRPPTTPPIEEHTNEAPTLLESWAFIASGYKRGFDIDDLKEDPPGHLTVPMMQGGMSPPIHYYVKDAKQCVLGMEAEDHPDWWLEYYLNNAEKYVVSTTSDGQLFVNLFGDQPMSCRWIPIAPGIRCQNRMIFQPPRMHMDAMVRRWTDALDYIYSNFCSYAKSGRPF
jgi:hypothetical protein